MTRNPIQTSSDLPPDASAGDSPDPVPSIAQGESEEGPNPILAYHRPRVLMALTMLSGFGVMYLLTSWLRLPAVENRSPSILINQPWLLAMPVIFIGMLLSAVIGSLIGGRIRPDAGLLAAASGLMAVSIRSGTMGFALRLGHGPSAYPILALELVILFAMLAVVWFGLRWAVGNKLLPTDADCDELTDTEDKLPFRLIAMGTQVAMMVIVVLALGQSDRKFQALAAVGLGSYLGTIAAHSLFNVAPSICFWIGSLLTGLIGFLMAAVTPGGQELIGQVASPLVACTPLDYASVGIIGALIGYWSSRKWKLARDEA